MPLFSVVVVTDTVLSALTAPCWVCKRRFTLGESMLCVAECDSVHGTHEGCLEAVDRMTCPYCDHAMLFTCNEELATQADSERVSRVLSSIISAPSFCLPEYLLYSRANDVLLFVAKFEQFVARKQLLDMMLCPDDFPVQSKLVWPVWVLNNIVPLTPLTFPPT